MFIMVQCEHPVSMWFFPKSETLQQVRILSKITLKSQKKGRIYPQNMVRKKLEFSLFQLEYKYGSTAIGISLTSFRGQFDIWLITFIL